MGRGLPLPDFVWAMVWRCHRLSVAFIGCTPLDAAQRGGLTMGRPLRAVRAFPWGSVGGAGAWAGSADGSPDSPARKAVVSIGASSALAVTEYEHQSRREADRQKRVFTFLVGFYSLTESTRFPSARSVTAANAKPRRVRTRNRNECERETVTVANAKHRSLGRAGRCRRLQPGVGVRRLGRSIGSSRQSSRCAARQAHRMAGLQRDRALYRAGERPTSAALLVATNNPIEATSYGHDLTARLCCLACCRTNHR